MNFQKIVLLAFLSFPMWVNAQIDHWETIVYGEDNWNYFVGNWEPPSDWNSPTFNDNNWKKGRGSIGYGDEDDLTIIPPTYALYMRHRFEIVDISEIEVLIFQADYDDGYVAYLNGVEVARANVEGNPPNFDTDTPTDHEATLYQFNHVESVFIEKEKWESILVEGENVLSIQVHNKFGPESSDMTANFFLSAGINNESRHYRSTPSWFSLPSFNSSLPIVKVTTSLGINETEPVKGQIGIINNGNGDNNLFDAANEYEGNVAIKFRGQSSLWFPKKNFSIEMQDALGNDLDTSFLDFPTEEDWVLHGPFSDKSLMRNVLTMDLARKMGQYASRTEYVDFYINGNYQGIYVLMEKIKRDKDRVDVAKLREIDIAGDEVTGGYIFKIDKDAADWFSGYAGSKGDLLEYQLVYPDVDKVQPAQFTYIKSFVDSFERAMKSPNLIYGGQSFEEYIDLNSFAEAHLLNELGRNVDGYRLSSYFHKQKDSDGGKILAGPVWDFNLAFRNADYCDGANTQGLIYFNYCDGNFPFWWDILLTNETFLSITRCRWQELRAGPFHQDSIFAFIDEQVATIEPSLNRNFLKWNIFGQYVWPNPSPLANSYNQEILLLKNWLTARLAWMDRHYSGFCQTVSTESIAINYLFEVVPNPATHQVTVQLSDNFTKKIDRLFLINTLGQEMVVPVNKTNLQLDVSNLGSGFYHVGLEIEGQRVFRKIMVN